MTTCIFFKRGNCTKGDACPFKHEVDLPRCQNAIKGLCNGACGLKHMGPCRKGAECDNARCIFEHPPQRSSDHTDVRKTHNTPCRWGVACNIEGCTFDHKTRGHQQISKPLFPATMPRSGSPPMPDVSREEVLAMLARPPPPSVKVGTKDCEHGQKCRGWSHKGACYYRHPDGWLPKLPAETH